MTKLRTTSITKFLILFLSISLFTVKANSQTNIQEFLQPNPEFKLCASKKSKNKCFNKIFVQHINNISLSNGIKHFLDATDCDQKAFSMYFRFIIDEKGRPIEESIYTNKPSKEIVAILKKRVLSLPSILPARNEFGFPILATYTIQFELKLDENDQLVFSQFYKERQNNNSNAIIKAPIYQGCNKKLSNEELNKCFSKKVGRLISNKYNFNAASYGFKKKGTFYTYVLIKATKSGSVEITNSFGPNSRMENEAVKSLKKIKTTIPGLYNDKPVNNNYIIPIKITI